MTSLHRRDFLSLSACAALGGVVDARRPAAADDAKTVNVLAVPTDGVKSLLYAQRANLFKKRGLQANITSMGSGAAIFAAVLGGSADVGSGSTFPVFAAFARGVPLRIIAPASIYSSEHPDSLLVVQKNAPFQTASDLNGKIIGVDALNDVYGTATRAWVDQHGGDGKSLRAVELRPTEQIGALDTGRIDAVVLKPPYLTLAMDTGKFRVFAKPLDAIGPRFLLSCWVSSVDFIAKNPDVVSGFVAALTEAARYTNANQAATTDMVAAFTGQDATLLGRGIRSTTAESLALIDLQRPLDFAYKYGIIAERFDLSGILASSVPLAGAAAH
jgi:NitT/TauT family transport system substrate-binding protein